MKFLALAQPLSAGNAANLSAWQARLALGFANDNGVTRLVRRAHSGPLRVQKALYPEGKRLCHAIIVHPPGGVVGGDELTIHTEIGTGAEAFVTTPGAAKWYKASGRVSMQHVDLKLADGAKLEWLPQETIFFDAAHVQLDTEITLGNDARFIGGEILCFGRTASGESFASGRISQRTIIRLGGKLLWFEQGTLAADSTMMYSPLGLGGKTVCATLIAAGKVLPSAVISGLRESLAETANANDVCGVTQMKMLTVVRCLTDSSERAKQIITQAWQVLRPAVMERTALIPRIWNT